MQRKIGFEFEVEVPLYHQGDTVDIFGGATQIPTKFAKDKRLHDQTEFHIVQDHAAQPIGAVSTIPEFVIHPQEESLPKDAFLGFVKAAQTFVENAASQPYPNTGIATLQDGAFAGDAQTKLTLLRQGGSQATFGVLPEGMSTLFAQKSTRFEANKPLQEVEILTGARDAAHEIIQDAVLASAAERNKIQGYLALICMYCVSNAKLQNSPALDKNKVPFLVRSSMGEVAKRTLNETSRALLSDNAKLLAERIIKTTHANSGTQIIAPTSAERDKVPNPLVDEWVTDALRAEDKPLNWGSETDASDSKIIRPERVGTPRTGDTDQRAFGAVLEERNLTQGQVFVRDWLAIAEEVWAYVREINGIR